jgi:hypothetical protein
MGVMNFQHCNIGVLVLKYSSLFDCHATNLNPGVGTIRSVKIISVRTDDVFPHYPYVIPVIFTNR